MTSLLVHFCSAPLACFVDALDRRVPGRGWGYTEATDELAQRIRDELQPDCQAFQLFRLAFQDKPKSPVKMAKWRCGCTTVRCAIVLDALCRSCGEQFRKSG